MSAKHQPMSPNEATLRVRKLLDQSVASAAEFMCHVHLPSFHLRGADERKNAAFTFALLAGAHDEVAVMDKAICKLCAYHDTEPAARPLYVPHQPIEYGSMSPAEIVAEWRRGCTNTVGGKPPDSCVECTASAMRAVAAWNDRTQRLFKNLDGGSPHSDEGTTRGESGDGDR